MKKKLLSYLILACSICGLTFVGSCKDYEIETLQEEIDNLKVETIDGTIQDQLDAIKQAIGMSGITPGTPATSSYIEKIYKLLGDTTKLKQTNVTKNLDSLYKLISDAYAKMKIDSAAFEKGIKGKVDTLKYKSDLADLYAKMKSDSTDLANKIASIVTCACGWPDALFISHVNTRLAADSLRLIKDSVRLLKDSVNIAKIEVRLKSDSVVLARHENRLKSDSLRLVKAEDRLKADSIRLAKDSIRLYKDSVDLSKIAQRLYKDSVRLSFDSVRVYRDSVAIDSLIKSLAKIEAAHADFVGRVELQDSLKNVEKRYKKADSLISASVEALAQSVDSLKDSIRMIWDTIGNIRKDLTTLNNKVIKLSEKVDTLENRVDSLMDAEKMRITSLYIQGTENTAFGTFALPIGVRSNILMAYYGEVKGTIPAGGINFPTESSSRMWFKENAFTLKDKAMLAASGFTLDTDGINLASGEELFGDTLGNAGKIYFTVNPNEVVIDTTKYAFTLRNSKGDSVKVKLSNIKPSEKQLKFGFNTRAGVASANGFWEADVTIDAADAQSLKPAINKEALVEVAKEMKKTRDLSLTGVTTSVLKSFNNVLDANALNVVWTDSMGKHSVTSGYDVAVAAITPLSYHTLPAAMDEFELTKKRLPLNPIDELLASIKAPSIKFNFNHVNLGNVKVELEPLSYNPTIGLTPASISVPVYDGVGNLLGTGNTTVDLTAQNNEIEKAIKDLLDSLSISFQGIEDSVKILVNRIQDSTAIKVNAMIDDVDKQFTDAVNTLFDDVKNQIGSNKFINRVNSLTSKINKVLDSANELLEVSLLYDKNGAFHPMSGTKSIPSVISGASEIELYPTSLTADILVPAYKRFVAVTNVIDPANGKNAQDDGGAYLTALTNANGNSTNMCDVIDANASITFKPAAGYIYEIAYSAIDYQGYISTRKFYVHVK